MQILNRNQLAEFLRNHESIRAFEELFSVVATELPSTSELSAGQAALQASQALSDIAEVANELATILMRPYPELVEEAVYIPPSEMADLNALTITQNDPSVLISASTAMTDGAAAAAGTLNNAPTAGNPTKWIAINDAGTIRYIPTW